MASQTGKLNVILMSDDEEEEEPNSKGQGCNSGAKGLNSVNLLPHSPKILRPLKKSDKKEEFQEHGFEGLDATIVSCFCEGLTRELAERYHCLIFREPSYGQAQTFIIKETRESYANEVKRELNNIRKKLNTINKQIVPYSREEKESIDKFVRKHIDDRHKDTELYVERSQVTVIGERYDIVDKTVHSLKVHLGHIQMSNRTGRQISMENIKSTNYEAERKHYKHPLASSHSQPYTFDDDDGKFSFEQKLSNGFTLKVYKASITKLDVDVIVNAANDNLMHGGGVARVISQAAGYKLDEESQNYIARNGFIKVTRNCETTAGRLNYSSVIHAVGPQWHDYDNSDKVKCMNDVYWTVFNVLRRCDDKGYRSVGIPAISAGIYGVPKPLCADMYVKAAVDYSVEGRSCPREMHFIDIDMEILKLVKESVEKWKKDPNSIDQKYTVPKYLEVNNIHPSSWSYHGSRGGRNNKNTQGQSIELSGRRNRTYDQQNSVENGDISDTDYASKIEYFQAKKFKWGGAADNFVIGNAIDILIFKSDIDKVRNLDALVCGIDKSLRSFSFVSKALEKAGGKKYEQGLARMKKDIENHQKRVNNVFKSEGGDLGVKFVLHLVNERIKYASKEEMDSFQEGIFKVLEHAKKWKIKTLAIPLIGTGDIQKDESKLQRCCSALLHAICDFSSKENQPSITEIHLINNSGQVCDTMVKVFKQGCEPFKRFGSSRSISGSQSSPSFNGVRTTQKVEKDTKNYADEAHKSGLYNSANETKSDRRTYTADGQKDGTASDEYFVKSEGEDKEYEKMEIDENNEPKKTGNLVIIEDD